jgi:hypothetical protein
MKSPLTPFLLALLLGAAGFVSWTLGEAHERVARADAQVAMLEYAAVAPGSGIADEVDRSLAYAGHVPGIGDDLIRSAGLGRATADYWQRYYDALPLERDAGGALVERDPRRLLLAANAAYRASHLETLNREAALDRLDAIVRSYADVLRSGGATAADPAYVDAAYNYEFAVRLRTLVERLRAGAPSPVKASGQPPTLHGLPGGPPMDTDPDEFKIVVPKRSDERNQNPEGGQGQDRERKG